MLNALHKLRLFGTSILLLVYLLSICQGPVLEVIHVFSHSYEWLQTKSAHHAYHDHQDTHQHTHLDALAQHEHSSSDDPFLEINQLDKKNQIIQHADPLANGKEVLARNQFFFFFRYRPRYQEVALPPPRNVYA